MSHESPTTNPNEDGTMVPLQQVYAQMAYQLLSETLLANEHIIISTGVTTYDLPTEDRVIVSYGWLDGKGTRGVCIKKSGVADKDAVIFIRPEDWTEPKVMLMVLTHEMIHAGIESDEDNVNHVGTFTSVAEYVGLNNGGTEPTAERLGTLEELATQLPPFPAAPVDGPERPQVDGKPVVVAPGSPHPPPTPKKQRNRNRRWVCDCGVIVRVSRNDFRAICEDCGSKFKYQPADSEKEE